VEVGNVDFKYLNWNFLFFLQVMNDGLEWWGGLMWDR
jgi:hypothetical protein